MLSFLLDEHISPEVSKQLQKTHPNINIHPLQKWENGKYLGASDRSILTNAYEQGLTLVTYDLRTIPLLLQELSQQEESHAGVVFINEKTIASKDIGGLVKALTLLWQAEHQQNWKNRIFFIQPPNTKS